MYKSLRDLCEYVEADGDAKREHESILHCDYEENLYS